MSFPCLIVRRDEEKTTCAVDRIELDDLPDGDVLIEVQASSLNYKDALACQGHPGVVRSLPHVPGIDCAGRVLESTSPDFQPGDSVLVTGYDLGSAHWGGYAAHVRAPADWVVPLPEGLTLDETMIYGTAGFTAAQCVSAIERQEITPDKGEVLVSGASGGVGSISVALLAHLGYQVVAVTGKPEMVAPLQQLGASRVISREEADDSSGKPLLPETWAAGVDTVGGSLLSTMIRSARHRGCIAACGLAADHELPLTVYPFILRGVTLAGIDSAQCPRGPRLEIWQRLAGTWKVVDRLRPLVQEISLAQVPSTVEAMLGGKTSGRTLVRPTSD